MDSSRKKIRQTLEQNQSFLLSGSFLYLLAFMFFIRVPVKCATDQKYPAQCIGCIDTTYEINCAATALSSALYLTEPNDFCMCGPRCLLVDVR